MAWGRAPLLIGLGFLLLGAVVLVVWRLRGHERFFTRRLETFGAGDAQRAASR